MKKFWISCALAFALMALVGFGFMPTSGRAAYASEKAAKKAAKASDKKKAGKEGKDFIYIHMQPLVLPVIGQDGAQQLVTLLIDLQVKDLKVSEKVRLSMPRIQDSIIHSLYGGFSDGTLRDGDRVDIPKIKEKIAEAIDSATGDQLVDAVLIQGVAQRLL